MADGVTTGTTGVAILTDEVTEGTLGTGQVQYVKLMDGAIDGTNKLSISSGGAASVTLTSGVLALGTVGVTSITSSTSIIGNVAQAGSWSVAVTSSTAVRGAVMPSTQWTVTIDSAQLNTLGQQVSASSVSVVGASDWTQIIGGDVSAASTDSGKPVKIGGIVRTGNPTALSSGERCNAIFDALGKQVVVQSLRGLKVMSIATTTTTVETALVAAGGASVFQDLYGFVATNTSTQFIAVSVLDSSGGTVQFKLGVPSQDARGFMLTESAALPQGTANKIWTTFLSTVPASGGVTCTALTVKNV